MHSDFGRSRSGVGFFRIIIRQHALNIFGRRIAMIREGNNA